jgi:hypothetical protein
MKKIILSRYGKEGRGWKDLHKDSKHKQTNKQT